MRKLRITLATTFTAVLALILTVWSLPAGAASVEPIFVDGNPTCQSLGYAFEFKLDPPNGGTYSIDGINTVTVTTDGVSFDWSSTLGMDAVISKGGSNANLYVYDPPAESFGDTGLHSPINPNNGKPFGLSHISFCFDYELTASKTANATYTRTYTWDITKKASPTQHTGFTGDSFSSDYEVAVDQTVVDSDFAVSGNIVVNNPTPFTVGFSVSDSVGGTPATVSCPSNSLAAGGSVTCTYSVSLGSKTDGTNTATITSSTTGVNGATATADYTFGDPTTTIGYPTINVSDSLAGKLGSASGDQTFTYSHTFTCDNDEGENDNIATIDETGQSASASVKVNCYALTVTKNAHTSFTRTWDWTIDKWADQTNLLLSDGQQFPVNYKVTVSATSADSEHAVSGNIFVSNPAPIAATINGVSDVVSPNIAASVDCGVTFPYTLAAGDTLNCTYSASLPDAADRTNTAAATLQNYSYDSAGTGTKSGTSDFTGSAAVTFGDTPSEEIDECIEVSDTNVGSLGQVCAGDAPKTFTYSLNFGKHPDADVQLVCGDNTHTNTASFVANDTGATGQDSWTVNANVACGAGCTLTQGYWKTHSHHGPAPQDDAWLNLGDVDGDGVSEGADETFFKSGKTYYEVLWTAPAGNVYSNLAHQYIAAKLNILNGASSTPAVDAAITEAETFFNTYKPSDSLSKSVRSGALSNAATLDKYNNGLIGPGHCSEQ